MSLRLVQSLDSTLIGCLVCNYSQNPTEGDISKPVLNVDAKEIDYASIAISILTLRAGGSQETAWHLDQKLGISAAKQYSCTVISTGLIQTKLGCLSCMRNSAIHIQSLVGPSVTAMQIYRAFRRDSIRMYKMTHTRD